MATIRFIENPRFAVDFQPFIDAQKVTELSLPEKVGKIASRPFELIGFVFIAVTQSASTTLGYSWISFKHVVLGYYGSLSKYRLPENFYLVVFKVVFWVLGIVWCFATTAFRLFLEQVDPPSKQFLTTYTDGKIDTSHLQTKELVIDVSNVPSDIKVSTLMTFFQEINFSDSNSPGYMAPSSRQEWSTTYTVDELEKSLKTFIKHVEGRVAFLATPPAYDTPRLMAFYQQIEDAIRFSIHKVGQDLETFQHQYGTDPDTYQAVQMRQYKNILENKARIAIDMAIVGQHCGSRYMSDATSTYLGLKGEIESDGTLQDSLLELLASQRSKIAQRQVYQHMGSDTHAFGKYMATLGGPLGIPGTGNVSEHLMQSFDYDKFLKLFFDEYSVDLIIDTVQEKIKKSQSFREKIVDWLKDQVADWNKASDDQVQALTRQIQPMIDEPVAASLPAESRHFEELITHLRDQGVEWPSDDAWDDFINELFTLDQTKAWFKTKFSTVGVLELRVKQNQIKQKFQQNILGSETAQMIKQAIITGAPLPLEMLSINESRQNQKNRIRTICLIPHATLDRVLTGATLLETALKDHLDLTRREEFLVALNLNNLQTNGVSPAILEWLLVSQHILPPQEVDT